MDPYEIKAGDKFSYMGDTYVATSDARGEFNTWVDVEGPSHTIIIRHGNTVTPVE